MTMRVGGRNGQAAGLKWTPRSGSSQRGVEPRSATRPSTAWCRAAHCDGRTGAALVLSGARRPRPHCGPREHHHHPLRGQPPRPGVSVLGEHRAAKQPRLGLTPPAASRRPSPRRSRPERTSDQATPPANFSWRRRLTRSIASGVPSWSVPNHRSHGMNGLP